MELSNFIGNEQIPLATFDELKKIIIIMRFLLKVTIFFHLIEHNLKKLLELLPTIYSDKPLWDAIYEWKSHKINCYGSRFQGFSSLI